jgi:neutral ceramidase
LVRAFKVLSVSEYQGKPIDAEVDVVSLGRDLAWVGLPGEIFVELGMAIKHASPFRYTIVNELSNDRIHYVPDRKAFAEGNYEVVNSLCAPGGGEALVDAATRLLIEAYKASAE